MADGGDDGGGNGGGGGDKKRPTRAKYDELLNDELNDARKALAVALAAMVTADEAISALEAENLAEAAVKTAEKTAEEVAAGVTSWLLNGILWGPSSPKDPGVTPWLLNVLQPAGYGLFFADCWGLLGAPSLFRRGTRKEEPADESAAQDEPEPAAKFLARIAARGRIAACCQNDEDM